MQTGAVPSEQVPSPGAQEVGMTTQWLQSNLGALTLFPASMSPTLDPTKTENFSLALPPPHCPACDPARYDLAIILEESVLR